MKYIKLMAIVLIVAMIMLPGFESAFARGGGGGGHGGGGHGGGGHGGGGHGGGGWHGGGRGGHGHGHGGWNGYNGNVYVGGGYDDGWGWGAADDAVAGMAVGAAIDDADQPSTVIVEQPPVVVVQQPTGSISSIGAQVTMLPPGSQGRSVGGTQLYQCGDAWYKPYFGANGVYYEVVPPPSTDNQ